MTVMILKNLTGTIRTYLGGTITVPANGSTTITGTINQFNVAIDAGVRSDCAQQILAVNDGFIDRVTTEALGFLDLVVSQTKYLTGATDSTRIGNKYDAAKMCLQGNDGALIADVIQKNNKNALVTDATVTVEQIFGFDDFADTWFQILTAGAIGNTWRIQIAAGYMDTQNPLNNPPATDVTVTVTAGEAGSEIALRDKIILALNADANFSPYWKASYVKDNTIIHITSKMVGEFGERLNVGGFVVTVTGTATFSYQNTDNQIIKRRGKQNSGVRDPKDRRIVTVGISGEVQATPGAIADLYFATALNSGSPDMRVNGSLVSPVIFSITPDTTKDIYIEELRFYGNANGIKFGQFLGLNTALTNGIFVEIQSDQVILQLPLLKTTDDLKHKFSFGTGSGFQLHVQSGRDDFMASWKFTASLILHKQGFHGVGNDDYIKVYIRDNLSAGLQQLEFLAIGFKRET